MRTKTTLCFVLMAICLVLFLPFSSLSKVPHKVLVVMSYHESYPWNQEIREGIESTLGSNSILEFFYMDTKNQFGQGHEKAKEAYELYKRFQPDGVIAADDNAQTMFVVPYLKDKVTTPVMFCGVNADPKDYGYPASNVSGVIERLHIGESLAFAQQLIPSIKTVGFMERESPSGRAVMQQFEEERHNYPVQSLEFQLPKNIAEAKLMVSEFKDTTDALFLETMEGLPDENGKPLPDRDIIPILSEIYGKPIITNNLYHVEYGTFCAVVKTGQEQGETAAAKLLDAMQGKKVSEIPISKNYKGKQVINVTVMQALGIKPKPFVLKNVRLVKTSEKHKVLVVMSYEENFLWDTEVKGGIEASLGEDSEIRYFYMDTKTKLEDGPKKAEEAYHLFEEFQPDGVIAVDDNAQAMFVVPYLKDKVDVPVIFCGVNAQPEKYGYPSKNVSGVLERGHIKESIAFLQELVPTVQTISYMAKESPTGRAVLKQAELEADTYSVQSMAFTFPKTLQEAVEMVTELKNHSDVLFIATMQGILDENGMPLTEKEAIPIIAQAFGKPIISDNAYNMKYGMFCAIAVSGQEQGSKAAKKLHSVFQGKTIDEVPITRNEQGRRMLNVSVMKELGITPKPASLIGVELIKTDN